MTAAQRQALRAGLRPCSWLRLSKWLWKKDRVCGATCLLFLTNKHADRSQIGASGDHLVSDTVAPFALAERGH